MAVQAPTRRQFLKSTTRVGATLTLAAALCPPARPVQAYDVSLLQVSQGDEGESATEALQWIASGGGFAVGCRTSCQFFRTQLELR